MGWPVISSKPMPQVIMVTNSCGCIFCDLDLEPYLAQCEPNEVTAYWHDTKTGRVKCTRAMK